MHLKCLGICDTYPLIRQTCVNKTASSKQDHLFGYIGKSQ